MTWASYYGADYVPAASSAGANGIPAEGWDNISYAYFAAPAGTFSGGKWSAASQPLAACSNTALQSWDTFNVTSAIQTFASNPTANTGFVIRTVRVNYDDVLGVNYSSSESDTKANRPKLVITYTPGTGGTTYALTVTGGTGDGSYESGKSVAITAEVPAGKTFVKWSSADGVVFADPTKASTTITMLGKACTVTAEFKDASAATYALTVTGGTGDGSYESGKSVAITAEVPAGKEFVKWSSADGVVFADPTKASTTITMLGKACTVTAEFKNIAVVLDTSNLSVNLVEFGSWSISADELGSKAVLDSSAQGKNQISADFTVIAGDDAKEIYPWTSMTASFDTAFDNSTLFKVKYSSNNRIRMVLVQGILGDSGVAFGYELPAADTTLYLKKEQFVQPDWTPDSLKAVLDLKTVTDISFESVKTGTASKITITELKASNYTVKKETAVLNREKMNLSPVMVNGSQVTISRQIQNPVVRVFGFNGRVLAERSVSESSLDLTDFGLSSGLYAVQVIGKDFQSPAMRCIVK